MKYIAPQYRQETVQTEDIMAYSPNDIHVTEESFDFGDGNGVQTVSKGSSHATIQDLLF